MLQRIKHIWNRTLTHRSEVTCIYIYQLILGVVLGCISYCTLDSHIGQSIALDRLASGFDRTVFMDIINNNDNVLSPIVLWAVILIPVYLLVSAVLQGGLLYNIRKGETGIISQIKSGIRYLLPFMGYTFFSVLIILAFVTGIGFIFKSAVGDPLTTFSSEKPFVHSLFIVITLLSVLVTLIWGWNISARYKYIDGSPFWASMKSGFSFVKNHFLKILLVGYLLIGIHLLLAFIYYLIMGDRGAPSWLIIILGIIVQQVFSFARVYLRSSSYITIDQIEDGFIGE